MMQLYKSTVRCKTEYCSVLWNPSKIEDIQNIESIQRAFTKRITSCKDQDYWQRLQSLKLMSLQRRRERFIIIHMHKILYHLAPNDVCIQFNASERRGITAIIPPINKHSSRKHQSLYDSSFAVMGPKLWNTLPRHVNTKESAASFKTALTNHILQCPDYPPTKGYPNMGDNSLLNRRGGPEFSHQMS